MTEEEFADLLREAMEESDVVGDEVRDVRTFGDSGLLTSNVGLVVKLDDGSEFQVTVVRSR